MEVRAKTHFTKLRDTKIAKTRLKIRARIPLERVFNLLRETEAPPCVTVTLDTVPEDMKDRRNVVIVRVSKVVKAITNNRKTRDMVIVISQGYKERDTTGDFNHRTNRITILAG